MGLCLTKRDKVEQKTASQSLVLIINIKFLFNINSVYYLHEPWTELSLSILFIVFQDLVKSNDDSCIVAGSGYAAVWKSPLISTQI